MDLREFTTDFLTDFFRTSRYFNIDEITKQATPKIIARKEQYKDWVTADREGAEIILNQERTRARGLSYKQDDRISEEFWDDLRYSFVHELFEVTAIPIGWASDRVKDDFPNYDCLDGSEQTLNLKYNIRLLSWAYGEVNAEDPKEIVIDLGLEGKVTRELAYLLEIPRMEWAGLDKDGLESYLYGYLSNHSEHVDNRGLHRSDGQGERFIITRDLPPLLRARLNPEGKVHELYHNCPSRVECIAYGDVSWLFFESLTKG